MNVRIERTDTKRVLKPGELTSKVIRNLALICVSLSCILPLILVVSISISDMDNIYEYGYRFLPVRLDLGAYKFILKNPKQLFDSYITSIIMTAAGGFFSLLVTSLVAYPMSRRDYKFKSQLSFYVVFTLLFNGGLVPWYIIITKYLRLYDNFLVLILPYLVHALYIIILRTFFVSIPIEMMEAASIDGANEYYIFWKVILPMSKPALATVGLLIAFRYWNDWWLGMLFVESPQKRPLQYLLYTIMSNIEELEKNFTHYSTAQIGLETFPKEPVRMAMAVLAAGPMLFVFPFFQRYFVRGMTIGAVKG
jgi:putative aldouronate transport system permease protein